MDMAGRCARPCLRAWDGGSGGGGFAHVGVVGARVWPYSAVAGVGRRHYGVGRRLHRFVAHPFGLAFRPLCHYLWQGLPEEGEYSQHCRWAQHDRRAFAAEEAAKVFEMPAYVVKGKACFTCLVLVARLANKGMKYLPAGQPPAYYMAIYIYIYICGRGAGRLSVVEACLQPPTQTQAP